MLQAPIHSYLVEVSTCPNVTSCVVKKEELKRPVGIPNSPFTYPVRYNVSNADGLQQG